MASEKEHHEDDDKPQSSSENNHHNHHSPPTSSLHRATGGGGKRIALLQTLMLVSLALMQQKIANASSGDNAQSMDVALPKQQQQQKGPPDFSIPNLDHDGDEQQRQHHLEPPAFWPTTTVLVDDDPDDEGNDDENNNNDNKKDIEEEEGLVVVDDEIDSTSSFENSRFSEEDHHDASRENNEDGSAVEAEDILIVSTVDGTLMGISRSTGEVLWKQVGRAQQQQEQSKGDEDTHPSTSRTKPTTTGWKPSASPPSKETESEAPLLEPLVSTTTTIQSSTSDWRTAAVPSIDGSVYLTAAAAAESQSASSSSSSSDDEDAAGGGDVTVTASLRELVNRAPFVDSRGRIYTGSRKSVAVAIDGNTGQVLQVVSADAQPPSSSSSSSSQKQHGQSSSSSSNLFGSNSEAAAADDDDRGECHARWQGRNVVWIGRVDHSISVHEPRSGDLDVQFSASQIMSVNDMVLGPSQPPWSKSTPTSSSTSSSDASFSFGNNKQHPFYSLPTKPSFLGTADGSSGHNGSRQRPSALVATPNGNLALRNPQTGQMIWVSQETFESPVAFAVDATTGESLGVDLIPDAATPNGSLDYLSREMERQFHLTMMDDGSCDEDETHDDDEQTIVGSLSSSGQLFAMPLGRKGCSRLSLHHHHQATISATASATAQKKPRPMLAKIAQLLQRQNRQPQLPQSQQHPVKPTKKACMPGMPHFPGCLVSSANQHLHHHHSSNNLAGGSFMPDASATASYQQHLHDQYYMGQGQNDDSAIVPFDDPNYHGYHNYVPPHHFYTLTNQDRNRKKYQKLLRILGSWLPPTIALIFVVSFELGRRKRQKDGVDTTDVKVITNGGVPGSSEPVSNDTNNNSGSATTDGCVIQVMDDEILGYGGHGTVVYKGLLDGRQVAVKRMLKAYHASADREISLLIESDGHPNVVRYFLKEVRGDFVYLALELCDLSLHDLIGNLRSMYDQMEKENSNAAFTISPSVKTILLQIANGVKHLHRLRIVHRDLKPANILLADSRKSKRKKKDSSLEAVYAVFQHGDYVAKISDMGLGKQIVGQSSYGGASTMLDSSLRGGGVQQSSIAGAGPGSVGWQAPEVMAMRASTDTSVRSESSLGGTGESNPPSDGSLKDIVSAVRTSRSIDIFSLGCIFYSTLVPASHPFGEWYEREANIMHNRPNMKALEDLSPDGFDLVASMLDRNPSCRPTAKQICDHPFFWAPERRLMFLCDFSDRLEAEVADDDGNMLSACVALQIRVERSAANVVGTSWDTNVDETLISNVQRFRTYDPSSIRDLLRLIRNKHHHYDELPAALKTAMGSNTDGLMNYFDARFPKLLIHCFNACRELVPTDDALSTKYSITQTNSRRLESKVTPIIEAPTIVPAVESQSPTPVSGDIEDGNPAEASSIKENGSFDVDVAATAPCTTENGTLDVTHAATEPAPDLTASVKEEIPEAVTEDEDEKCVDDNVVEEPCGKDTSEDAVSAVDAGDMVIWEGSTASKMFNCRGWSRSDDEWTRRTDAALRRPPNNNNLNRCATDPKFRTRLCNHWDASRGTFCPMRKKNKCVFAHGPAELRVKEAKRNRWGKLVDKNGDTKNPRHSGGEDTYGAARSIETERNTQGKWNVDSNNKKQSKGKKPNAAKKKVTKAPERTA